MFAVNQHADHVETVRLLTAPMSGDPDTRRATQLPLLLPVNGTYRISESVAMARLDLHERDEALLLDYEIDVAVPRAKPALDNPPALSPKPSLRDALPQLSQCLPGR